MATVLWDKEIDKYVDWAGDNSTQNQPVSGKYVQKFIKDTLAKKFGYLYYDKTNSKYWVFADEDDYNRYANDTTGIYADLRLAVFDAPAPATITLINQPKGTKIVLLGSTGNVVNFAYYIKNSSDQYLPERVSLRVSLNRSGEIKTFSRFWDADDNYDKPEVGTAVDLELDEYLTDEGIYDITVTLTGLQTQATTSFTFSYNVVNLNLTSTFDNSVAIDNALTGEDEESYFSVPYVVYGAARQSKIMEIFIDGEEYTQTHTGIDPRIAISSGDSIGTNVECKGFINLYMNVGGELVKWPDGTEKAGQAVFGEGKHSIQIRSYILNGLTRIYSITKYYEFVVVNSKSSRSNTYLIYETDLGSGELYDISKNIQIKLSQYDFYSMSIKGINSRGNNIKIKYIGEDIERDEEGIIISRTNLGKDAEHTIASGATDVFNNTFTTKGENHFTIYGYDENSSNMGDPQLIVEFTIAEMDTGNDIIEESLQSNLLVKYSALNRSNTESEEARLTWKNSSSIYGYQVSRQYPAVFSNKILWKQGQDGWDGEALILKNGATVEFPIDLFGAESNFFSSLGLTFEIDFETSDVQNDDALIMDYSDSANDSYIKITATSLKVDTNSGINKDDDGSRLGLKTNFKDNTRNKIAVTFNPIMDKNEAKNDSGNPNLVFIYVNGVLDRAARWGNGESSDSDSVLWTGNTVHSIKIGNPDGQVTTKIYSIRIYNSAINPEQAFMNYLVDSGSKLKKLYDKNNVLSNDGTISLAKVKDNIPTLVLSFDASLISGANRDKKKNTSFDGQFFDPTDPSLNFYVRNGWISCQGTSSMNYPVKNLRPYLNKTNDKKSTEPSIKLTSDKSANAADLGISTSYRYETEFWPVSEYQGHEEEVASYIDENGILPYSCNAKMDKSGYHIVAQGTTPANKKKIAKLYSSKTELYVKDADGNFVMLTKPGDENMESTIEGVDTSKNEIYISAYRPVRRTGMSDEDYEQYLKELRWSGVKLYTRSESTDDEGNVNITYSELKKKKAIDFSKEYYSLGSYWRQYNEVGHVSGWTDRWTVKADYAESSNCHNSGIARLWGAAMKNIELDNVYVCRTKSQNAMPGIDIRTSVDGKPIVIFFKKPIGYNKTTGLMEYGDAEFAGLYGIMTDKSSTKLFGFEDMYDENGKCVWKAYNKDDDAEYANEETRRNVQCWEYLQNGSLIGQGLSLEFDREGADDKTVKVAADGTVETTLGDGRPIFNDFEGRWPETGQERHEYDKDENPNGMYWSDDVFGVDTTEFETLWNWVNFTKPAVNYLIDGYSGYDYSDYVQFNSFAEAVAYKAEHPEEKFYIMRVESGNEKYYAEGEEWVDHTNDLEDGTIEYVYDSFEFDPAVDKGITYYRKKSAINRENVTKSVNKKTIGEILGQEIYIGHAPSYDAINRCFDVDGAIDDTLASRCLVDVYVKRKNNKWYYTNNYNKEVEYGVSNINGVGALFTQIDPEEYERPSGGTTWRNSTFMDYFEATMEEHLDIYKMAAYYIYVHRFAAVDQVIKNSMMTTEDGKHWYFINYDNDTVLGVRNDAILKYNWDVSRDTWDESIQSYAFAGARSILWNNLQMSSKFMEIVKSIDNKMYSSGLLSERTVLQYLDEKQMGTWCERLYNHQEEIKYLSTFKKDFNTQKFLDFVQGTRQSHRDWWVHKRWELYDAMWSTGSYAEKRIEFYNLITSASSSNPVDVVTITASSKYYFSIITNGRMPFDHWFKEADTDETVTFYTTLPFGIGDPLALVGPGKIKVLNFRPSNVTLSGALLLNANYDVWNTDTESWDSTNWVEETGTTMLKLLIGDGVHNVSIGSADGLNTITSLEEIDFRNVGIGSAPLFTNLKNLHILRASGSNITSFEAPVGATMYELSLPSDAMSVALQSLILNNTTFMAMPENYYVQYQDGEFADKNLINDESVYGEDAHKYCLGEGYVFDVIPTQRLNRVEFNNVSGIDTKQFVMDWRNAINNAGYSLGGYTLSLTGIDWTDITVSELIEFRFGRNGAKSFNFTAFSGKIFVKSDNPENDSITLEEYERIVEAFGKEVFTSGNNLVITTNDGIFFRVLNEEAELKENTSWETSGIAPNQTDKYYEVIRGTEFEVSATIFPINKNDRYAYVLERYYSPQIATGISSTTGEPGTDSYVINDNYQINTNVSLRNTVDSTAIFLARDIVANNDNGSYRIAVYKVEDGVLTADMGAYIYIKVIDKTIPTSASISTKLKSISAEEETEINTNETLEISKIEEHTISFSYPNTFNAKIKNATVRVSDNNSIINLEGVTPVINGHNVSFSFTPSLASYNPDYYYSNTINGSAEFTLQFDTERTGTDITITQYIQIDIIYPTRIKIVNAETDEFVCGHEYNEVTHEWINTVGNVKINDIGTTKYRVVIEPENYNVQLNTEISKVTSSVTESSGFNLVNISNVDENNEFTITVKSNLVNGKYQSFIEKYDINVDYRTIFGDQLTCQARIEVAVAYPDRILLTHQDYNNEDLYQRMSKYVHSGTGDGDADIYLVDGQGTDNDAEVQMIKNPYTGLIQHYLEFHIDPQPFTQYGTATVDVTEKYNISINPDNINVTSTGPGHSSSIEVVELVEFSEEEKSAGKNGYKGFRLGIKAASGKADTITVSGTYTISFDEDKNPATINDTVLTKNFEINIHRSVAKALSYKDLNIGEMYVVDSDNRFYQIEWNDEYGTGYTDADTAYESYIYNPLRIAKAQDPNIDFIGVGMKTSNERVRFIYLKKYGDTNTYDNVSDLYRSFGTVPMVSDDSQFGSAADESLYDGYDNTHYIKWTLGIANSETGKLNPTQPYMKNTLLYKIFETFENNEKIQPYFPTYKEVNAIMADPMVMAKYDRLINHINTVFGTDYLTLTDTYYDRSHPYYPHDAGTIILNPDFDPEYIWYTSSINNYGVAAVIYWRRTYGMNNANIYPQVGDVNTIESAKAGMVRTFLKLS